MEPLEADDPLGVSISEPQSEEERDFPGTIPASSFDRAFECPNCGKKFAYRKRFIMHLEQCAHKIGNAKQVSKVSKKPLSSSSKEKIDEFHCNLCDKVFNQKADLNCHLTSHSHDKPYECIECGRRFSRKEYLIRHIPTHSFEKIYTCPICNYKVSRPDRYKLHMNSHGVSNPFKCSLCGQGFPGLKGLNKHLNSHNSSALDPGANTSSYQGVGLCTFNCVECGITFERAEKYKQHMLKHGVEEPYECSLCGDSFASKLNLNRHLSNHNSVLQVRGEVPQNSINKVNEAGNTTENSPYKKKSKASIGGESRLQAGNSDRMSLGNGETSSISNARENVLFKPDYPTILPDMKSESEDEMETSNNGVASSNENRTSDPESDQPPTYSCNPCALRFSNMDDHLEHMKVQHKKLFACRKCGKSYTRKSNLKKHPCGGRRSAGGTSECTTCGISFPSVKELDDHIISHISGTSEPDFGVDNGNVSKPSSGESSQYITDESATPELPKKKKKLKHRDSTFEVRGGDVTYQQKEIYMDDQIASYLGEENSLGVELAKKKKKIKRNSLSSESEDHQGRVPLRKIKAKPKSPLQVLEMLENELEKCQSKINTIASANRLKEEKTASEYERLVLFEFMTMTPVLPDVDHSIQDTTYDVVQVNDKLSMKFFM
ncbi:zinc finger protein 157-like [Palaemon carinicauda]|uniref:zinc finger protein 157-like n=1 Tax=Palaemon carinicauda TaxID=392227 RepID=UPI0035B5A667